MSKVIGVCPNCEQWVRDDSNDCFNECRKRGFAGEPLPKDAPLVRDAKSYDKPCPHCGR